MTSPRLVSTADVGTRELAIILGLAFGSCLAALAWPPLVALPILAIVVGCVLRWPAAMVSAGAMLGFLLRPSLDAIGDVEVLGINPASAFGILILVWGVTEGVRRICAGEPLWPDRLFGASQLLLIALHVTLLLVAVQAHGRLGAAVGGRDFVRFLSTLSAGMLLVWWLDQPVPRRLRQGYLLLIAGASMPLLLALFQAVTNTGNHEDVGLNRVFGTFTHPLTFGSFVLPLFLLGGAATARLRGAARITAGAGTLLCLTLIALTYNRTTMLLLVAAVGIFAIRMLPRLSIRETLSVVVAAGVLGAVAWDLFGAGVLERFSGVAITTDAVEQALATGSQNSFQWRIVVWAVLINLGLSHPWIGQGLGMTSVLNPMISPWNGTPFNAHNDIVRFFFEGGVLGLSLYFAQIGVFATWLWRVSAEVRSPENVEANAIAAALIALYVFSLGTTEMTLATAVLYEVYLLLGVLSALRRGARGVHPR